MTLTHRHGASLLSLAALLLAALPALAATEVVTEANLGVDWYPADTRAGGSGTFDFGPAVPPLGGGSFHMDTNCTNPPGCSQAKVQMFTDRFGSFLASGDPNAARGGVGVELADIDGIGYWSYRESASTNPMTQVAGLNMEVDFLGDGASYTILVYEPYYNAATQGPIQTDVWQEWDAYDGGNAIWWSSRDIPGVCAFNCFVPWSTVLANNPNARITRFFGFNDGSGWTGVHYGAADGLTLSVAGEGSTTFDFDKTVPVRIDLRPGSDDNQVNTRSRMLVPNAILGAADFDATQVDPLTVVARGAQPVATKTEIGDVDGDGYPDLTLYFRAGDFDPKPTPAECDDPDATLELTGSTLGGVPFAGSDSVRWIGPDCKG